MQARGLGERESPRPIPQIFIDEYRSTGARQDFATCGTVAACLRQLAANTDDPEACVEWMAEKFKCISFHNGNFVNEVIRLFKGGELTADGAAVAVKFYLSRARTFLDLSDLSNRAQFLYFAIQLASLLPDPKQGAMEAMNAYLEASMFNLGPEERQDFFRRMTTEGSQRIIRREHLGEFTQIAKGLKAAKDAVVPSLMEQEQFKEKALAINWGVNEAIIEFTKGCFSAVELMSALHKEGVFTS
ncbi:MAG: hypothetical protein LBF42_03865 [Puniceicoccales bacterium]|nr:hypothetical protein [Puniceicoccales bacterium]